MNKMIYSAYRHPKKYDGIKFDTEFQQEIIKAFVEYNCLNCDKFNGREHDFYECNRPEDCPKPIYTVSLIDPKSMRKCESD